MDQTMFYSKLKEKIEFVQQEKIIEYWFYFSKHADVKGFELFFTLNSVSCYFDNLVTWYDSLNNIITCLY